MSELWSDMLLGTSAGGVEDTANPGLSDYVIGTRFTAV